MRNQWLLRKGNLYVGQDLEWHFAQVHGHDRHVWIMDEWELGRGPAETMHLENRWMSNRAATMIDYYEHNRRVDEWLASEEGKEALEAAHLKLRTNPISKGAKSSHGRWVATCPVCGEELRMNRTRKTAKDALARHRKAEHSGPGGRCT